MRRRNAFGVALRPREESGAWVPIVVISARTERSPGDFSQAARRRLACPSCGSISSAWMMSRRAASASPIPMSALCAQHVVVGARQRGNAASAVGIAESGAEVPARQGVGAKAVEAFRVGVGREIDGFHRDWFSTTIARPCHVAPALSSRFGSSGVRDLRQRAAARPWRSLPSSRRPREQDMCCGQGRAVAARMAGHAAGRVRGARPDQRSGIPPLATEGRAPALHILQGFPHEKIVLSWKTLAVTFSCPCKYRANYCSNQK